MAYPDVKLVAPLCIAVERRQYHLDRVSSHDILRFDWRHRDMTFFCTGACVARSMAEVSLHDCEHMPAR
jgi:hypothetical protein